MTEAHHFDHANIRTRLSHAPGSWLSRSESNSEYSRPVAPAVLLHYGICFSFIQLSESPRFFRWWGITQAGRTTTCSVPSYLRGKPECKFIAPTSPLCALRNVPSFPFGSLERGSGFTFGPTFRSRSVSQPAWQLWLSICCGLVRLEQPC